jgi:hypothetical protein
LRPLYTLLRWTTPARTILTRLLHRVRRPQSPVAPLGPSSPDPTRASRHPRTRSVMVAYTVTILHKLDISRLASVQQAFHCRSTFRARTHVLLQRVRLQEITIGHVPDRAMPADFLTKWIGASKLNVSVEHVTNSRHAPTPYATHLSDLKSNPRHGLGGVLDGRLGIRSGTRVTSPSHAR